MCQLIGRFWIRRFSSAVPALWKSLLHEGNNYSITAQQSRGCSFKQQPPIMLRSRSCYDPQMYATSFTCTRALSWRIIWYHDHALWVVFCLNALLTTSSGLGPSFPVCSTMAMIWNKLCHPQRWPFGMIFWALFGKRNSLLQFVQNFTFLGGETFMLCFHTHIMPPGHHLPSSWYFQNHHVWWLSRHIPTGMAYPYQQWHSLALVSGGANVGWVWCHTSGVTSHMSHPLQMTCRVHPCKKVSSLSSNYINQLTSCTAQITKPV